MTSDRLDSNHSVLRDRCCAGEAAWLVHDACVQRRTHVPLIRLAPRRKGDLRGGRRRRETRTALDHLHNRDAVLPCCRLSHPLCADAPAGGAAAQSGRAIGGRAGSLVQYGGQLRHQHQLAELRRRKHDVLPRADARPDAPELPLRRHRHRAGGRADPRLRSRVDEAQSATSGSISPAARSTSCCRSASSTRYSWFGRACRRHSGPTSRQRRSKARSKPSRSVRSPRRSRSRCSAPMAAASSTPMRRIRSRTRPRCRTSCR